VKLHHNALDKFRHKLYADLIYPHQCSTDRVLKYREFVKPGTQHFCWKECDVYSIPSEDLQQLFILDKDMINKLPIRVKSKDTWYTKKDDKQVTLIQEYASFKILPVKKVDLKEIIADFITPHSKPEEYELYIVLSFALLLGKGACWFSGNRAFGKSSVFKTMNYVFDNVIVKERPRTVPAFYKYIPADGVMVFDELSKKDAESAENIADVLNIMGDVNEPKVYMKTGGSAAFGTNVVKDITNCSTVCLFNLIEDYSPREKFAEFMFSNNEAIDRRFLKLRLSEGELDFKYFEEWSDYTAEGEERLRDYARTICWYKQNYRTEVEDTLLQAGLIYMKDKYKQTHYATMRLFLSVMSIYWKEDPAKFQKGMYLLEKWIKNYRNAISNNEMVDAKAATVFDKFEDVKDVI
jgi:hypothetical protein